MRFIVLTTTVLSFAGCSCSTLWSPNKQTNANNLSQADGAVRSGAARVQAQWQKRFEGDVLNAGNNAEGWALFSDSSMGHTGQQLVIRRADGNVQLCYADAATNECSFKSLDAAFWQSVGPILASSESLGDHTVQTFDAMNMEYVHLRNNNGKIETSSRLFFMVDEKPLPEAYDKLMDTFTKLPK